MVAGVVQECLSLLNAYPKAAREASIRARFASSLGPLRFGVQTGEISLEQLLVLPLNERRDIVEQGPIIDWYLGGDKRVYKRTTRTLLFAICPDVGRHIEPMDGRFIVRLPDGFSKALAVKLAVLYMEQYLLSPKLRTAPSKVEDDIPTHIYLAELFAYIGMSKVSRDLEDSILRRFREAPLPVEEIRAIWSRDNHTHPSRYIEAMADNIVTFMCVPKLHLFAIEHEIEPEETYKEVVKKKMDAYLEKEGHRNRRMWFEMTSLERLLAAPANVALKQLVWTANTFTPKEAVRFAEWIEIRAVRSRMAAHPHLAGMRKIVLAKATDMEGGGEKSAS
ncbi:hypothetical protein E8E11_010997 [Didymella keratinophila]|nr:hypothetical protein E8E11_010997 [Didymella keratinophila]